MQNFFYYKSNQIKSYMSRLSILGLYFFCLHSFCTHVSLHAQIHCTSENRDKVEEILQHLADVDFSEVSRGDQVIYIGKQFLGTPYVAKTLELPGEEQLVVNVKELDCTTYLENVVVLSRLVNKNALTFSDFQKELALIRYKDGTVDRYPSRLHYFTDWIYDNEKKGILIDITKELGGESYNKAINFMSQHRESYAQLTNEDFFEGIKQNEAARNQRANSYYYIPKAKIVEIEKDIQHGDLVAITTGINGLDIVHVGIAYKENARLHLLHASTRSNEVEITQAPLAEYMSNNKSQSGIMVMRLN